MNFKLIFGLLSVFFCIPIFVPYLIDIFKSKTQPHVYTWLLWTLLQGVAVFAGNSAGGGYGFWGLALGTFLCFVIFLLSLKYGTKNISKLDTYCLLIAVSALLFYFFTTRAIFAVVLVTVIDAIAFAPTYRKGWSEPRSETLSTFIFASLGNIFAFLALEQYAFVTTFYITSLILTNGLFALMLFWRRKVLET